MSAVLVVLAILTITSVSSGRVYVKKGSDIGDCNMKCPDRKSGFQLYQKCEGKEDKALLELRCDDMLPSNNSEPRFSYNTSSGCWRLMDARKDDSCLYIVRLHNRSGAFEESTAITVLDSLTPLPSPGTPLPSPGTPLPSPGTPLPSPGTPAPSPGTPAPSPGTPAPSPAAIAVLVFAALAVVIGLPAGIFLCCKKRRNVPTDDVEMQRNGRPPRADQSDPPDVTGALLDPQDSHEMNGSVISAV
ncbi:uncharacterized protein [Eleutherodactylus coqui]|uniref:uncharacterized protein isoform X2 n=1 Tax=Eleutherodactylus coqui TaxID=57060 RepID=UPI003462D20F